MTERETLTRLAEQWISLWTVPVDWALFDRLHAEEFEDAASAGRPTTKAGFAQGLKDLTLAFPDLKTKVEDLVLDTATSKIGVRWSAVGTNQARYLGVGPTHKATHITGIEVIEVRGRQIVKRWGEWDITKHTHS
jgi:steroid delta-isomerase-like uncharacterized protein